MIVDVHQHLAAARPELRDYKTSLLDSRGANGKGDSGITAEAVTRLGRRGTKHSDLLTEVGTDVAFISPRPYAMMHSEKPEKIVHWHCEAWNDAIAFVVQDEPGRFRGIAGLPQSSGVSPTNTFEEIDRCINDLGFIGVMLNPDPGEGDYATPVMGDEYWYPLYEKLEKMDVPALIHPAFCNNPRESFHSHFITEESIALLSLCESTVFEDFPKLKLIISHGGGSIPYQVGRWRSQIRADKEIETFDERLKRAYFDTVLYNRESLKLLFKIVGPERCMFGTERPGAGSKTDPRTGRWYDDLKPVIESIGSLSAEDKDRIFERNAQEVYTRFAVKV